MGFGGLRRTGYRAGVSDLALFAKRYEGHKDGVVTVEIEEYSRLDVTSTRRQFWHKRQYSQERRFYEAYSTRRRYAEIPRATLLGISLRSRKMNMKTSWSWSNGAMNRG